MNSTAPPLDGFLAQDQSNRLIIVVIIFAILEALFIGLFFAARVRMGTARAVDTYLMIPAFIMAYSHLLVSLIWIKYAGLGRHWAWVSQSPLLVTRYLKMKLVMLMINGPGITLPKLAILCLYLRIFQVKPYRFATFAIGGILIATWIASWSVAFAMCTPYSFQWNKSIEGGTCLNEFSFYIWMGIPSIATDLAMIILPMPIIWRLQTSIGQRIGLTITFVAGGLGIVTAVIRFVVFLQLQDPSFDLSWTGTEVVMWTTIEPGVYLIAACLPSLRPVLLPFFNGLDFHGVRSLLGIESRNCNTPPSGLALSGVRRPRRVWRRQRSREKDLPFKHSDEQVWRGTFGDAGNANCYRESLSEDTQRGNSRAQAAAQFENKDFSQAIIVETAFTVSTQPRFA